MMMRLTNTYLIVLSAATALTISACNNEVKQAPPVAAAPAKAPAVMEPFKFHKMVEVSPGNDFDVMNWSRGPGDKSSLLILHSDSISKDLSTTTGDLDGPIVDVYNSDMDVDGNPEIIIQAKTADTNKFMNIIVYEFNGGKGNKLDFPRLTVSQRKGYRGGDNLYVTQGRLVREFPIYDGDGKTAKPTGQKRTLEYNMHGNTLSAQTISKDTTSSATAAVPVTSPAKKSSTSSGDSKKSSGSSETRKSSKKHQDSDQPKKKKKKKHHHSD